MPTPDVPQLLRGAGLRVTRPRSEVLASVYARPHADTDSIIGAVRDTLPSVSHQAVYDSLRALTDAGLLRRIQPAGSGTTGHAVALQNVADGGARTCLSVNHPETVRPGSNADLAGYARVSDVTRARLRAVADVVGGGFVEGGDSGPIS